MATTSSVQPAGKVEIKELILIAGDGTFINLPSFLVELNIFEDIYSSGLYGNIVLNDSIGLVHRLSIVGEEYLNIKIDTPGFDSPIWKTFRCVSVTNREFTRDTTTESYVIHFVSPEVFMDHYMPVQRAFSGPAEDIVADIFKKYLTHPRHIEIKDGTLVDSEEETVLSIFTECKTPVKFISPSWSPMKCISWLASKVKPTDTTLGQAPSYLFFETNKQFYWGTLEDIVRTQRNNQSIVGVYVYSPGDVKNEPSNSLTVTVDNRVYKSPDINRDFLSVHSLSIEKNVDVLQNSQNGYLASVYHELDVTTRTYKEHIYDHVTRYPYFQHTSADASGFFATDAVRSPYNHQIIGFKHIGLFSDVPNNLNEQAYDIVPPRTSLLAELDQVKMRIVVHGRTDIELGSMMYLVYPKSGPKTEIDKNKSVLDSHYSGLYVITAVHHKITLENHSMTMEIVKDSYGDVSEGTTQ